MTDVTPQPTPTLRHRPMQTPEATFTPTPKPAIPPYCPNPQARLTKPTVNATLKGIVEVTGSANIDSFDYYKFELRPAGATEWSTLQLFRETVADGLLGIWDTSPLPAGAYTFRLVVVDKTGNYPEPCEVEVIIKH